MSPIQLCVSGLTASNYQISEVNTGPSQSDLSLSNLQFNFDTENLESVEVPCNKFNPCNQLVNMVESLLTPATQTATDGKTMYRDVIHTVGQHLQDICNRCSLN